MTWLIQYIVSLIEAIYLVAGNIAWMPAEAGVSFIFALLCLVAAVFDLCPRRVLAMSALLYLLLGAIQLT